VALVDIAIDAYFGQARDVLQLSREAPTRQGHVELRRRIEDALSRALPYYVEDLRLSPVESRTEAQQQELRAASLEAFLRGLESCSDSSEWLEIHVPGATGDPGIPMRDIVHQDIVTMELVVEFGDATAHLLEDPRERIVSMDPCTIRLSSYPQTSWIAAAIERSHELSYGGTMRHDSMKFEVYIWPRMICPFTIEDDGRVTLRHLHKYVRWTGQNAEGGPKDEVEVAKALWAFLQDADAAMAEAWKGKVAYDLTLAKHQLTRWLK
jgi:hypothetical protein